MNQKTVANCLAAVTDTRPEFWLTNQPSRIREALSGLSDSAIQNLFNRISQTQVKRKA